MSLVEFVGAAHQAIAEKRKELVNPEVKDR
jgi:hypothetical protein